MHHFANIFLLVCMLSFPFVYGFLCSEKLRSLIRSHLFIFAFISIVLRDWPKKTLIQFTSENVLPVFSSRSFMVSWPIFYFFKPFWVYFCVWCECVLTSVICMLLSNFPSTACWRYCLFPIVYSWFFCCRLTDYKYMGLFLDSSVHWSICLFLCQYHTFDYYSFVVLPEDWEK